MKPLFRSDNPVDLNLVQAVLNEKGIPTRLDGGNDLVAHAGSKTVRILWLSDEALRDRAMDIIGQRLASREPTPGTAKPTCPACGATSLDEQVAHGPAFVLVVLASVFAAALALSMGLSAGDGGAVLALTMLLPISLVTIGLFIIEYLGRHRVWLCGECGAAGRPASGWTP